MERGQLVPRALKSQGQSTPSTIGEISLPSAVGLLGQAWSFKSCCYPFSMFLRHLTVSFLAFQRFKQGMGISVFAFLFLVKIVF